MKSFLGTDRVRPATSNPLALPSSLVFPSMVENTVFDPLKLNPVCTQSVDVLLTTKKDDSLGKPFNTSLFDHRKKIAGGIFEPGDRVPLTPKYSLLVRFEFTFFIFFETDTSFS